jgi:hypothetical protein
VARLAASVVTAVLLASGVSRAQSEPLTTSDFNLELFRGPVQGSSRVTGMAGAFTGIAEESVAIQFNPAAIAQRTYYSLDWFDWLIDWDFLAPGLLQGDNFDYNNSGYTTSDEFLSYAVGGGLQFGEFGVGVYLVGQIANLESTANLTVPLQNRSQQGYLSFGYGLLEHQLILGAGTRVAYLALDEELTFGRIWSSWSMGFDLGAIYRPRDLPLRFGASLATSTFELGTASCETGTCPGGFIPPQDVVSPWIVRLGGAWYLAFDGQRFNPPRLSATPSSGTDELHYRMDQGDLKGTYLGGRYFMVSADLVFVSPVANAIGIDGLTRQERLESGQHWSVSVALGLEAEVVARRLRLRAGSYWEPSRYEGQPGRIHATAGWLLRMFDFRIPLMGWRGISFQVAVDLAYHYTNITLSLVSFWH